MKDKILVPAEWLERLATEKNPDRLWEFQVGALNQFRFADRYCTQHDTVYSVESYCNDCLTEAKNES